MNIIGRLTKNAELRTTSNEKQVVNFSIATNDSYRNKQGEKVVLTNYFNCSYWLAPNIASYLTKGSLVEVEGRLGVNAWKDMQGEARANLTLHVNQIKFHSGKLTQHAEHETKPLDPPVNTQKVDEDLPF